MTADRGARPQGRPSRRLVAAAVLATAIALAGIAGVFWPDGGGVEDLVSSPSATARRLGLLLVVLVLPAVLAAAAALSRILRWLPGPRAIRAGLTAVLWAGAAAFTAAWLVIAVVTVVLAGLVARDVRADSELAALPERIAAVPGVIGAGDAQLDGADLASGHNLHVTADLEPDLTREERLRALDRMSAVLAEHQSNDLRMVAETRSGPVAVGVSGDPRRNRYRLSLAEDVAAATGADLVVVTWNEPSDNLIHDDERGVRVVVHSSTRPPDLVAAAAVRAVRAFASVGTVIAQRNLPSTRPPASYSDRPAPAAAREQVRVELLPTT